jgi:hypothetical protein
MRTSLLIAALLGVLPAAAPAADAVVPAVDRLATRMCGNFSNATQARSDFSYRDVVLHIVRIWPERSDGPWLYLEQALADAPAQPYRQQIYHLVAARDGVIDVRVLKLSDPVALTAAWRDPARFASLTPEKLIDCAGCAMQLKVLADGSIQGATVGCACASELSSAAYATTDLTVTEQGLVFWDRGFTSTGLQVWGPANSGYEFKRLE